MPAKRSSNKGKGKGRGKSAATAARNDFLGLALAVVAIGSGLMLYVPSDAIVSHAVAEALRLGFGVGALIVPIALGVVALVTLFQANARTLGKVGGGLGLIVVSVLAIVSIVAPGAEADSSLVLQPDVASATGGYLGGAVAWVMLELFGEIVGIVVLVGLCIAGAIVCGFSISGVILRVRGTLTSAAEHVQTARAERAAKREEKREAKATFGGAAKEPKEGLGSRMRGFFSRRKDTAAESEAEGSLAPTLDLNFEGTDESEEDDTLTLPEERRHAAQEKAGISTRIKGVFLSLRQKASEKAQEEGEDAQLAEGPSAPTRLMQPVSQLLDRIRTSRVAISDDQAEEPVVEKTQKFPLEEDEAIAPATTKLVHEEPAPESQATLDHEPQVEPEPHPEAEVEPETLGEDEPYDYDEGEADADLPAEPAVDEAPASIRLSSTADAYEAPAEHVAFDEEDDAPEKTEAIPFDEDEPTSDAYGFAGETAGTRISPEPEPEADDEPGSTLVLPPLSSLRSNPGSATSSSTEAELARTCDRLQSTLEEFGLRSRVTGWVSGPLVTTFKIEMGEGERVNKITNLEDDIALSLAAESVRIFAPIPGTSLVGIEIPNVRRQNVCLGDVLPYAEGGPLELALGRDAEGRPVVADLARMPHLLIAGATGSGKSVMINSIIMSILMRDTPEQVRLIMIDPKRVELGNYNGLPHLYVPVVTEPRQASSALQWAVTEMDRRLKVFERAGARDILVYNGMVDSGKFDDMEHPPAKMPYLVLIIDELSDLMMVAGKDVEASIVRIAQLARAAGIHLIVATQRPSADVVTGLIKSNIENRIAFSVASGTDSRVILDQTGAERLLGRGDMLFRQSGKRTRRVLGCYVSDPEIESVVDFIRDQGEPDYHDEILSAVVPGQPGAALGEPDEDDDPLVWEAAKIVVDSQLGSTSGLQRRLKVGYARAGRIMDNLEQKGVVGPPDGSKPREVLLDADGLEELRVAESQYREV